MINLFNVAIALPLVVDHYNTIVTASPVNQQIFIWFNGSSNLSRIINTTDRNPISLFPISDNEILVGYEDSGYPYLDRWSLKNGTLLSSTLFFGRCTYLFVDINDDLYCSAASLNIVIRKPWRDQSNMFTIVAGTGSPGSTAVMLASPRGIYVTTNLDLYVADCNNDRVQFFRAGEIIATTVAGNGSNSTLTLNCPRSITLDANGYLFITLRDNNRLVTIGPESGQCVVGCTGLGGSGADQLSSPWTFAFDNEGNLFVADFGNRRIQTFQLMNQTQCSK